MSGSVSAATSTASNATSASATALSTLTSNFQDFLGLLMTQLQNQDPTSPMDANQFTSELVEFSGVEQQISMNGNLSQLITLTQSGQDLQSASIVGHEVQVASPTMPLQNSTGTVQFSSTVSQPVTITVTDANGNTVAVQSMTATQGTNDWTWDGTNTSGGSEPDGAYTVAVNTAPSGGGTGTSVPFTVLGTVTGVTTTSGDMSLNLGAVTVPISSLQSIVK